VIRILDRLVAGSFIRLFLIFVLGAPMLFVLGDVTENLDKYLDRGLSALQVAQAYMYQFPKFVLWSFPIAALLAAVFTVHSMTAHREIVAAKAGGISFYRVITPIIILGFFLTGAALVLSEVVPRTNRMALEILEERNVRREWRSNFVFQSVDGSTRSIRRLTVADGRIEGIMIERPSDGDGMPAINIVADEAVYDPDEGWVLRTGYLRKLSPKTGELESSFRFDRLKSRTFAERPHELLEDPPDEDEMTYAELGRQAEFIMRSGGEPRELLVKREQKLAIPLATLVIVLFGAPLATSSKRGGTAYGIGISLASTVLYLLLLKVAAAFGAAGNLDPLTAAWLPNAVFFVAGVILLARVRT
jgi:lipopolysaccharide export system permease protein